MTIANIIYTIFIGPLKLLFEVVFSISYTITCNSAISIVILSLFVNIILLPLTNKAELLQEQENEIEKKLKPGLDHIKKTFKGDEQYMMIQAYYRENNYKQFYSLRGLISLGLEIPFFIAAYNTLSNLSILSGASFGPITDLSKPDGMLLGINVLPILMTIINIVSSLIYTKGQTIKNKIQLIAMALVFVVLLYSSPSGLVIYWTINNIFSLVKNLIKEMKINKRKIYVLLFSIAILFSVLIIFINPFSTMFNLFLIAFVVILFNTPFIIHHFDLSNKLLLISKKIDTNRLFFTSTIFLTVLIGLYIPIRVINASPAEFVNYSTLDNPLNYVQSSLCLALGTFSVWLSIFYLLMNKKEKCLLVIIMSIFTIICVVNYLYFGTDFGTMSNKLIYDNSITISLSENMINMIIIIMVALLVIVICFFFSKYIVKFNVIALLIMIIVSFVCGVNITRNYKETLENMESGDNKLLNITLSKNKKNVVVIMIDAAVSLYFPVAVNEKQELKEQFSGFTYYPNTASFSINTITASASVYGGYEYTPSEFNNRSTEKNVDKHNEALKMLPVLFNNNNFDATTIEPPLAGYNYGTVDLSIFDDYPNISAYHIKRAFSIDGYYTGEDISILNRNLFCYSIMKASPLLFQTMLYQSGSYNNPNMIENDSLLNAQEVIDISNARGINDLFARELSAISNLSTITYAGEKNKGSFVAIYNELPHEDTLLQEPEYEMEYVVNNEQYDLEHAQRPSILGDYLEFSSSIQKAHYDANMRTYIELGKWFDYLRELGVYDNTKIILVSDHGRGMNLVDELITEDGDLLYANPVLLVKDYDSDELTIDYTFMTNADVPTLATKDVIDNPVNPFTNKPISNSNVKDVVNVYYTGVDISEVSGTTYPEGKWYSVKDNVFDINNWQKQSD